MAKTDVPMNDEAATVATTAVAVGRTPWWDSGDVPDDHEGQGPAAGDVVGGRGQVEDDTGGEAEDGRELGAAGQRGGDHDEQDEVGDDALPREVGEERHLQDQGDRDGEQRDQRADQAHRRLPSASMTERSLTVPEGTTTPTRSSEPKSTNGSITARCEVSRMLE